MQYLSWSSPRLSFRGVTFPNQRRSESSAAPLEKLQSALLAGIKYPIYETRLHRCIFKILILITWQLFSGISQRR